MSSSDNRFLAKGVSEAKTRQFLIWPRLIFEFVPAGTDEKIAAGQAKNGRFRPDNHLSQEI